MPHSHELNQWYTIVGATILKSKKSVWLQLRFSKAETTLSTSALPLGPKAFQLSWGIHNVTTVTFDKRRISKDPPKIPNSRNPSENTPIQKYVLQISTSTSYRNHIPWFPQHTLQGKSFKT